MSDQQITEAGRTVLDEGEPRAEGMFFESSFGGFWYVKAWDRERTMFLDAIANSEPEAEAMVAAFFVDVEAATK